MKRIALAVSAATLFGSLAIAQTATEWKPFAEPFTETLAFGSMQPANEWRASKVIGLNVFNGQDEKIGDINDMLFDSQGRLVHAVIGVGGFLGMGEKNVAVNASALKIGHDAKGNWRVLINATKEQLKNAPQFTWAVDKTSM